MKIAIIGASGFIGSALYYSFAKKINKTRVIGTYYENYIHGAKYLDASNPHDLSVFFNKFRDLDLIILSNGIKDLNRCENDYSAAYENNVQQIINIVESLRFFNKKTKIIYISSNYVFDGERGSYTETDKKNPQTLYGKTKSMAEDYLMSSSAPWIIVRTASVIGRGSTFIQWLIKNSSANNQIKVFDNVNINPTPITMLVDYFNHLIFNNNVENIENKIFHFVSNKTESKYSFVLNNYKKLRLKSKIIPVNNNSFLYPKNLTMKATNSYFEKLSFTYNEYLKETLIIE